MVIGLLRLRLHLPNAHSLKERRSVVRRAADRVRARFPVSVAEVGDLSRWQVATLAVSLVTNERAHANEVLDKVVRAVASAVAGEAEVTGREMALLTYNDDEPIGTAGDWMIGREMSDDGDRTD